MIPKIIHQIHLGSKPLSEEELHWQKSWLKYNPDWTMFLWDDTKIYDLPIKNYEQFKRCKNYSEQSDILRFEVIYKFGGIYIDTDFECLRDISSLVVGRDLVLCLQTPTVICGAFIAATKENKDIKKIIDGIPQRELTHSRKNSAIKYGPGYITDILGIKKALSKNLVYPYLWTEKHRRHEDFRETCPEAYAVHHWKGSWL